MCCGRDNDSRSTGSGSNSKLVADRYATVRCSPLSGQQHNMLLEVIVGLVSCVC